MNGGVIFLSIYFVVSFCILFTYRARHYEEQTWWEWVKSWFK